MDNKPSNWSEANLRMRVSTFSRLPALRCGFEMDLGTHRFCNKLAIRVRQGRTWLDDTARCAEHADSGDLPLGNELIVRRVRLECCLLVAGVDLQAPHAHTAALELLEHVVNPLGAVLELHQVTSSIGRYPLQPGIGAPNAGRGVG